MKKQILLKSFLKIQLVVVIVCFSGLVVKAQKNEHHIEFKLAIEPATDAIDSLRIIHQIPKSLAGRQSISELTYSVQPSDTFSSGENLYAVFVMKNLGEKAEISIKFKAELFKYDLASIKKQKVNDIPIEMMPQYLQEEKYIEISNAKIKRQAMELADEDEQKAVRNIFDFVRNYLYYEGYIAEVKGAAKAFQSKSGDCTEFADLFVALCRADSIPARVIDGITTSYGNTPLHSWAEVYLQEFGWVRVDPTPGQSMTYKSFENKYLQLSSIRNDPALKYYYRYTYTTWGGKANVREDVIID
ncbi:transglutaminase-like domain-containing protein [Fulvivirga ligni]|uniref:transglutaminase-like domain-containing protein n=1 Tax=Fulvivirga ligni TaxID=2904246 RepID=UPI001F3AF0EB|nr:transglutaminase-like domain-containing protein [Fulvivirga ligni]UII21295.1 transglutaminase-like domain-containing protein [Fulvivirga ligni]